MLFPFGTLATRHFEFLEHEFGFRRINVDDRFVRWESTDVFVQVYFDATRSYEVGAEIGQLNVLIDGRERPFDLGEVARLAGIPCSQLRVLQATTEDALSEALAEFAGLLKHKGQGLLRNDVRAFEVLGKHREAECQIYAEENEMRQVREAAKKAWHERDYRTVIGLYARYRERLSPAETKRYEIALKQSDSQRPVQN